MNRNQIKEKARESVRGNWMMAIGGLALYSILASLATAASAGLGIVFLVPALSVGITLFFIKVWRREGASYGGMFDGFSRYIQTTIGMLWKQLWTVLWTLLLIVPGIIKSLSYSMTPYLIADNPNLEPREALKISMKLTQGHKMDILWMRLSFLGWNLLSVLTAGLLYVFYVGPYQKTAYAGMYASLLQEAMAAGRVSDSDLGNKDTALVA